MNIAESETLPATSQPLVPAQTFVWAAFATFLVCYLARCLWSAIWTPLWLDEVLSVWVIRLHSAKEIWSAIYHGSEFAPPTYPLLLHYYSLVAGDSYLALRLVSIVTAGIFAACCFVLFRRYLGLAAAVLGCCIILEAIRIYALQVRPYCFSIAFFGAALVFWDDLNDPRKKGRPLLICLCLAAATSFHFYSVLFIPCLGLVELLRFGRTREIRFGLWIALFVAGLTTLLWLPLIHGLSAYNAGDTASRAYYGHPRAVRLAGSYTALFAENQQALVLVLATGLGIAVTKLFRPFAPLLKQLKPQADFWALATGVSLLPCLTFAFSVVATHTYNNRYVIGSVEGLTACLVGAFAASVDFRKVVPYVALLGALMTLRHPASTYGIFDRLPVFQQLPSDNPIVVTDVQQFFTLEESAPSNIRPRLVYLRLPPGSDHPDPTVVNQLMRWKVIDPSLPVVDAADFLSHHKDFSVIDTHAGIDDSPLNYLLDRNAIRLVHQFDDGSLLFRSRP